MKELFLKILGCRTRDFVKTENKAFKVEKYVHSYPHCWRTDKPVLYYPLDSWFVKMTSVRNRLVELNETINWKPKSTGGRKICQLVRKCKRLESFSFKILGILLLIWRSEDLKEQKVIGSVEELVNEIQNLSKQVL